MMATTETLRDVLRTSRGQPILKLQSAEQRASLALDLLSLGSRAALGVSFLLSVSDRLGFYGNPGERGVSWGTFERFLGYAAKVNAFAPAWMIPFLGTAATVLELRFGVTLVLGLALRWGRFRQRGPALPIRFSHGDLVWDQVAIRLLCIRCDVLRPISGSRRLKSMDRRLFTVMLHEVEKRAIRSTHCGKTSGSLASKSSYYSVTLLDTR
jgi:putative oxidoreductase